jgi:CheY-like chemotaxis protein
MDDTGLDTVILVCDDETNSREILSKLSAQGIGVIGPATTASMALTLAAQTFANIAVLARRPDGGPLGPELARRLMKTWGVRSLVLEDGEESHDDWAAMPAQAARLKQILAGA